MLPFLSTPRTCWSDWQCLWGHCIPNNCTGVRQRSEEVVSPCCVSWRVSPLCHTLCRSSRAQAVQLQGEVTGVWRAGLWSCLSLALLPSGVSGCMIRPQIICSCLLWHHWYLFTCSHLWVKPAQVSLRLCAELQSAHSLRETCAGFRFRLETKTNLTCKFCYQWPGAGVRERRALKPW